MPTPQHFNEIGEDNLPGHLGIEFTHVELDEIRAELLISKVHLAPNGFLHAGTIVTLADTAAGYGCLHSLPAKAKGFTTIELKSNHLGTALDGTIVCIAKVLHRGRTTQVWDAVVSHRETGKTIALFRCTQLVLYPPAAG